ncbi:terminase family protein, partial [Candidatus Woesearchaeota archaeon]|nr:terminase family protein [Candidatus Woesearchaeota archaeon]
MAEKLQEFILTTEIVEDINEKENLGKILKRHEKLWFTNTRGVRKANLVFAMTEDEFEEYVKCKINIHYFAEKYCQIKREDGTVGPMKLRDYQKEIIDLYTKNSRSILMASRQTGKTVSAAIVMLHFVLFNDDKGVMIVANKGKTVKEIIRKIKDIYKLLPFFLKKGVVNWNETQIAFENNSRIQTENRTREPSLGFTIDLLYLDEFAHIPDNFIRDYYGAIVPVVSSVENSRIIITSTPDGFNMFWELLTAAELPEDDPRKNPYKAMRVYWTQVPGREDTKIKIVDAKLKKFGFIKSQVLREIREKYNIDLYKKRENGEVIDCVKYNVDDEKTYIDSIRKIRINGIPLPELAVVTNWQEDETKLIGSPEKFDQEYGLHFITGDKILFNKETIDLLKKNQIPFDYVDLPQFEKLRIPYDSLKFVRDINLFNPLKSKDYYILFSLDLAEGLAKDYSVINIFRLMLRDKEEIERYRYDSLYDLFKIEQIGLYRNNVYSIREIAHIFYLLAFEVFDPEKVKVVLEMNTYGGEFLSHLPNVFEGNNYYFNAVFLRYKHNREDIVGKIGLKLNKDKHLIIDKEFQQAIRNRKMILHSDVNISEITTFSKHETASGNVTYKAESGHDDVVMSTITLSTCFDNVGYKNLVDLMVNNDLQGDVLRYVE